MRIELWVEEIRAVPVHRRLRAVRRRGAGQPGPLGAGAVRPGRQAPRRMTAEEREFLLRTRRGRRGVTGADTAEPVRRPASTHGCRAGRRRRLPGPAGPAGPGRAGPAAAGRRAGRVALWARLPWRRAGGPHGRRAGRGARRHGGRRGAAAPSWRGGARALPARRDAQWRWPLPPARSRRWRRCPAPSCGGSRARRRAPCATAATAGRRRPGGGPAGAAGRAARPRAVRGHPDAGAGEPVEVPQRLVQAVGPDGLPRRRGRLAGRRRRDDRSGAGGRSWVGLVGTVRIVPGIAEASRSADCAERRRRLVTNG